MEEDMTPQVEAPTEQPAPETDNEHSTGSEAQTNTEEPKSESKLIPIPADKWREANQGARRAKQLEKEIETLRASQPSNNQVPQESTSRDDDDEVIRRIASAVRSEISPHLSYIEEMEREQALKDVSQREHADELASEIARAYLSPELESLSIRKRMDRAYVIAVGENIEKITAKSSDSGYDRAYQKISEKQSAEGTHQQGIKSRESGELTPDDIRNMSPAEYEKHRSTVFAKYGLGKPE